MSVDALSAEGFEDEVAALREHFDIRDEDLERLRAEDDPLAGRFLVGRDMLDEIGRADTLALSRIPPSAACPRWRTMPFSYSFWSSSSSGSALRHSASYELPTMRDIVLLKRTCTCAANPCTRFGRCHDDHVFHLPIFLHLIPDRPDVLPILVDDDMEVVLCGTLSTFSIQSSVKLSGSESVSRYRRSRFAPNPVIASPFFFLPWR